MASICTFGCTAQIKMVYLPFSTFNIQQTVDYNLCIMSNQDTSTEVKALFLDSFLCVAAMLVTKRSNPYGNTIPKHQVASGAAQDHSPFRKKSNI